jgi:RNA polymerase sigma-70 factor (ECF subfamily)
MYYIIMIQTYAIQKASGNEQIDVGALYSRFGAMVLRRCRQLLVSEDMAADAMQETFVRVLRRSGSMNARYPSSLLFRIATNVCLNMLRSKRRARTVSMDAVRDGIAGREMVEDRVLDSCVLEQVFSGTKEGTRKAAVMHYLEGCTLAETAEGVDLSVSGVRKRLLALREQGRAFMGEQTWRSS